jgi:hypothetical protein
MAGIEFDFSDLSMDEIIKNTPQLMSVLSPQEYQLLLAMCKAQEAGEISLLEVLKHAPGIKKPDAMKLLKSMAEKNVLKKLEAGAKLSGDGFTTTTRLKYERPMSKKNPSKVHKSKPHHIESTTTTQKSKQKQVVKSPQKSTKEPMEPTKHKKIQRVKVISDGASINNNIPSISPDTKESSVPEDSAAEPSESRPAQKLDMKKSWTARLNSKDKDVRAKAINQIGAMYGRIYANTRQKLMPRGGRFYVAKNTHDVYVELWKICNEYEINFTDFIKYHFDRLQNWGAGRPFDFPTPKWLLREEAIQQYQNRKQDGDGIQRTPVKSSDAFRTRLKNPSLPDLLKRAGFDLDGDQVKYVERVARQRKVGVHADCEVELEAAVVYAMEHGCPDM